MFGLPTAKGVRREDINTSTQAQTPSRSPSPDAETAAELHAKLASIYGDVVEQPQPSQRNQASESTTEIETRQDSAQDDSSYAFRLFSSSTSAPARTEAAKIVISSSSPPPDGSDGGGLISKCSLASYLTSESSRWSARQRQFRDVATAVPGSWIHAQSQRRNPGLELSWRVSTLKLTKNQFKDLEMAAPGLRLSVRTGEDVRTRSSRPNKKRRILLREKKRKREAGNADKERIKAAKEKEEQEKRTRRNREKKVKRKMKEKAKKGMMATGAGDTIGGSDEA